MTRSSDWIEAQLAGFGVPPRLLGSTFEGFHERPGTGAALRAAREWSESPLDSDLGLVLIGPPGTGKTHLAIAALRERLLRIDEAYPTGPRRAAMFHAHFTVVPIMLDRLRADVRTGTVDDGGFAHLRDRCPLLVLDDLGHEQLSDWVTERVYVLIEARYGRMLPIIVTTNRPLRRLQEDGYGAAVSRLAEMARIVAIGEATTDYRLRARR